MAEFVIVEPSRVDVVEKLNVRALVQYRDPTHDVRTVPQDKGAKVAGRRRHGSVTVFLF